MMGMGREMIKTPQMAQVAPHSLPNQVLKQSELNYKINKLIKRVYLGVMSPYPTDVMVMMDQ